MGKFTGIRATSTASDFEGSQFRKERITEQVVVGTHGKLKAWANKRILSLDGIRILVFDEADEMLKADAFADDSVRLIKSIRKKNPGVQLLLFSATFNEPVKKFAMQVRCCLARSLPRSLARHWLLHLGAWHAAT